MAPCVSRAALGGRAGRPKDQTLGAGVREPARLWGRDTHDSLLDLIYLKKKSQSHMKNTKMSSANT